MEVLRLVEQKDGCASGKTVAGRSKAQAMRENTVVTTAARKLQCQGGNDWHGGDQGGRLQRYTLLGRNAGPLEAFKRVIQSRGQSYHRLNR